MEQKISITWSTADVQGVRPDLNDEDAYAVLLAAQKHHDATIGINWDVLSCYADSLFPEEQSKRIVKVLVVGMVDRNYEYNIEHPEEDVGTCMEWANSDEIPHFWTLYTQDSRGDFDGGMDSEEDYNTQEQAEEAATKLRAKYGIEE